MSLVVLGCAYWVACVVAIGRTIRFVPLLAEIEAPEPLRWPRLSVVVPACNEAESIEGALGSLLALDYPSLEVVAIDDRSTDGTGDIIARLGASDPKLRRLRVEVLPEGWLGKIHAMDRGVAEASGEWLLFTDADVHFAPEALRKAVAYAEARKLDHLTALPVVHSLGFWGDTLYNVVNAVAAPFVPLWRMEDPEAEVVVGLGAFNLVRASAFARTPGFEWLKLDVADDMALALMIKRHGGLCSVVNGRGLLSLQWYTGYLDMMRKTQKNFYAIVGRFSMARLLVLSASMLWLGAAPLVAFAPLGIPWSWIVGLVGTAAMVSAVAINTRWQRRALSPALFAPVGLVLLVAVMLRAGWLGARMGGISWRGTLYESAALKAGTRFKM